MAKHKQPNQGGGEDQVIRKLITLADRVAQLEEEHRETRRLLRRCVQQIERRIGTVGVEVL